MRYGVDPSWWRHSRPDGEIVTAGSPVRIFRFTKSAASFLDDIESGRDLESSTLGLQRRLVEAGAIHPMNDGSRSNGLNDITVVIPAHVDDTTTLDRLIANLPDVADIIVIDDGSSPALGTLSRARIVRHESARGPAAARNRALDLVETPFVLFLDHDIDLPVAARSAEYWQPLLFHMGDPHTALVAPRVSSLSGASALERYEVEHSPLDMGSSPARVTPGSRVSYVPSAALLLRTESLRALGGFDAGLRYGEDVDLVWRAHEAGLVCRYEPAVVVFHHPRSTWWALVEQRFRYGTAAALLEQRHPGATRPVRCNRWSAATVATAALGHPVIACAIAATTIARLAERLRTMPNRWLLALRLAGLGHLHAWRNVLESAVRAWWPITVVLCSASRRSRSIIASYLMLRTLVPLVHSRANGTRTPERTRDPIQFAFAEIGDDIAYGSGVWFGALTAHSLRCLAVRLD